MHVATGMSPDRARRWQVLTFFVIIGLLASAFSFFPSQRVTPQAAAAVGGIYKVSTDGAARHMYVAEYGGLLYVLWSDFAGDSSWALRLSTSQNAEGTAWNYPENVGSKGVTKPDFPKIKMIGSPDGRMHAVWSDAASAGAVRHAWFTPGSGKSPSNPSQWDYETVSGSGKAAAFDVDPDGNAFIVWDTGDTIWGRVWYASNGTSSQIKQIRSVSRLPGIAVTNSQVHLVYVDTNDKLTYYRALDKNFNSFGEQETAIGGGRSDDPSPTITKGTDGSVYMVWSMSTGERWEIHMRQRLAGQGLGPLEKVSHNYVGDTDGSNVNHSAATVAVSPNGTVWVGWTGAETGTSQIYERQRAAGTLFTDYGNPTQFCVSCGNTGAAGQAEYGSSPTGAIHLVWQQRDGSGGDFRVWYSLRAAGGGVSSPSPSPSPSPLPSPPVISAVNATPSTLTSATVTWNTDTPSSSRVFYSLQGVPVDTSCTLANCTAGDPELFTNGADGHSVTIRGLGPGKTYSYQVRSTDEHGQVTLDPGVRTFTTSTLEIVGNGETYNGKFSALVYVPAGVQQLDWTANGGQTFTPINLGTTTVPQVYGFAGDLTPSDPAGAQLYSIYVRYNGQGNQISTTATIDYNPAHKPVFNDVDPNGTSPYAIAIYELAGRGIVHGSNGSFRPLDPIVRAEVAAIVDRELSWEREDGSYAFSDQGLIDDALWDDIEVLANYGVARGFGDGTFQPMGNVAQAQVISLITRAMIAKGYWQLQADDGSFPQVPNGSGHRQDIVTFNFYTQGSLNSVFSGANYAADAERRFVAYIGWEAIKWREAQVNGSSIYELP